MSVEKICKCGEVFLVKPSRAVRAKYCSSECRYKFRVKGRGFRRVDKTPNPSWYTHERRPTYRHPKGYVPWNKGLKGVIRKPPSISSNNETKLGYDALHLWVRRNLGRAESCSKCGQSEGRIHWANKSREYKQTLGDWISLCASCHVLYDKDCGDAIVRRFGAGQQEGEKWT